MPDTGPLGSRDHFRIVVAGPATGGIATVTADVALRLSQRGFPVEHIAVADTGLPAWNGMKQLWKARRAVRQADILHIEVGAITTGAFWFAALAAVLQRHLVLVAHDAPLLTKAPGAGLFPAAPGWRDAIAHKIFARLLDAPLKRWLISRTQVAIVLNRRAKRDWRNGPDHIEVIALGNNEPHDDAPSPSTSDLVLFAGFLGPDKGVDLLCEAWGRLTDRNGMRLVIAGDASRQHQDWVSGLHSQTADDFGVEWRSSLDDEEFARLISDAAVVVLPYRRSNPASGILVRAMVEGRTVIATRTDAMLDAIEDGSTGLLVEPGDAGTLTTALSRVISDPVLRDQLGANAKRYAASHFTWDRHLDGLEKAYGLVADPLAGSPATKVVLAANVSVAGGVSRHLMDLASALRDWGVDVSVELPSVTGELANRFRNAGIEPVRWASSRNGVFHLHLANTYDRKSLALTLRQKLRRRQIVITEHLPRSDASDPTLEPQSRRKLGAYAAKSAFKRLQYVAADRVIALSDGSATFLSKRYRLSTMKLRTVPNGVQVPDDLNESATEGAASFQALITAALIRQKGVSDAIAAFKLVKSNWEVDICGMGPHRPQLEFAAKGYPINFLGWRNDIDALMAAADVVCVPSLWESSPYTVLEAMAAAKPVIGTAVDGTSEMILDGVTGYLVAPGDGAALARALDRYASLSQSDRAAMGRAARERVEKQFSVDKMLEGTLHAYRRIDKK